MTHQYCPCLGRACRSRPDDTLKPGLEPRFEDYGGSDPIRFVVSLNLHRRHLTESQRAMVADTIADMQQGARTDLTPIGGMSQADAAELLNVGIRTVQRAAEVRKHGTPELVAAVNAGTVSVFAAADVATLPVEEQVEMLAGAALAPYHHAPACAIPAERPWPSG